MIRNINKFVAFGKLFGRRAVLSSAALLAATVMVGAPGIAAAQQPISDPGPDMSGMAPANVLMCRDGFKGFGFENQGQCISWWNHHHGGNGYGGHGHHHHHHHRHISFSFSSVVHYFFSQDDQDSSD